MNPHSTQLSISPLDPQTWAGMSPKAKWDSLAALRGPDASESREGIKHFTSSVIRWRLSAVLNSIGTRAGGAVNPDHGLVIVPRTRSGWFWNAGHYFEHVIEASQWLEIPILSVDRDLYINFVGGIGHASVADSLKRLVEEIVKGGKWDHHSSLLTRLAMHVGVTPPEKPKHVQDDASESEKWIYKYALAGSMPSKKKKLTVMMEDGDATPAQPVAPPQEDLFDGGPTPSS